MRMAEELVHRDKVEGLGDLSQDLVAQGYKRHIVKFEDAAHDLYAVAVWARSDEDAQRQMHEHKKDALVVYVVESILQYVREIDLCPDVVGLCPECSRVVFEDEPDGPVWTCPRNLDPKNRYWMPGDISEEQQEADGVYSQCFEDFGGYCGDHMPLHRACYAGYFTVVPATEA